jgi:hypothetical protein
LFDGKLGTWTQDPYHIELKPDAKPYHSRAFAIPKIHEPTLKKEVQRLCDIGVLKRVNRSEWAAPCFIIPKKNGTVRFITDFRKLNERIVRKPYPIPKIQDLMLKLEGFRYATSLDLNMGYYHIELSPDSKKLCTIVLPFGKYEYQRLPMGLCNSPDIFQEKMAELFHDWDYVRAYLDDLLITTKGTFEDHMYKLDHVMTRLAAAGLSVNISKSFFAKGELEYLGYWITRQGIQPLPDKVKAMQNIATPKNKRELRGFIGLINYYRDMWIRRSHVLAPLASLCSKNAKWEWTDVHQRAFDDTKKIVSKEVLLAYPDFSKPFTIHTDASHTQLGAVISQDEKPIAFYSRKLNPAQTRYTTTERELLSIVETLKEFRNILLGHRIIVHTDHKNLTYETFNTERVMRWRLIIEEFGPELKYIKGERNIVADALSRLEINALDFFATVQDELQTESTAVAPATPPIIDQLAHAFGQTAGEAAEAPAGYPVSYPYLQEQQQADQVLQKKLQDNEYHTEEFKRSDHTYSLVCDSNGKIVIPSGGMRRKIIEWYHNALQHPGETRTELNISQHYSWPNLQKEVSNLVKNCTVCKFSKKHNKNYGLLPPKENLELTPWKTVCIDLIGPYQIGRKPKSGQKPTKAMKDGHLELRAMTMIDPATGWFEIVEIPLQRDDPFQDELNAEEKSALSYTCANLLEQTWFNRYPWPEEIVCDRGREFMDGINDLLKKEYNIVKKMITTRNPQANSMVERAHQTVHNLIRTFRIKSKKDLVNSAFAGKWDGLLSSVAFAMRATIHTTLQATPSQLVFGRDHITNTQFIADWHYIRERKQKLILQNNKKENATRIPHHYNVGDRVIIRTSPNRKHGVDQAKGPYIVDKVYDNGTLRLRQVTSHGNVYSVWNLRNLEPCESDQLP